MFNFTYEKSAVNGHIRRMIKFKYEKRAMFKYEKCSIFKYEKRVTFKC